jgi:hypothetical protein
VSITYDAELPEWAGSPTVTRRPARHATIVSFATLSF